MAWREVKAVILFPQMLLQLIKNPQTNKIWMQNLPWPGTAAPTVHKFPFLLSRAMACEWSQPLTWTHVDFWWVCAPALLMDFWKSLLWPRPEAALAENTEHVMWPTSMDLHPAASSFPREGQFLHWQLHKQAAHLDFAPGVSQPVQPGALWSPSAA